MDADSRHVLLHRRSHRRLDIFLYQSSVTFPGRTPFSFRIPEHAHIRLGTIGLCKKEIEHRFRGLNGFSRTNL